MGHLNSNPVLDATEDKTMILNMGPQHPSTHGVLRLLLEIDGETIVRMMPDIGFLHTGIEKTCEAKFYQQIVPLTDRIDYLCPMINNLCYVMAVEKLLGLEIPPRAQWMRVMLAELELVRDVQGRVAGQRLLDRLDRRDEPARKDVLVHPCV